MHLLLDTSVLSEARRPEPIAEVQRFLKSLPTDVVAIPPPVIFELERGARLLGTNEPERAKRFLDWLDDLLDTTVHVPVIGAEVSRIVARMAAMPKFRKFWGSDRKLQFGCDPTIAAIAIHYRMPIASRDIRDFLSIHEEFPLPGLYEPFHATWIVPPDEEWGTALREDPTADMVVEDERLFQYEAVFR